MIKNDFVNISDELRNKIVKYVIIYIFLAISTAIIASYIYYISNVWVLIISLGVVFFLFVSFILNYTRYKNLSSRIRLAFAYDTSNNELVSIERYEFSEVTKLIYDSYCNEIDKDKDAFVSDPIHKILESESKTHPSIRIIKELTGYYLIKKLSYIVNSYYSTNFRNKTDNKIIAEYNRGNLNEFVEYNRFFDILTNHYSRRAIKTPESIRGELSGLYSEGKLYELINFKFPKGTTIKMINGEEIEIKSSLITIVISIDFFGLNFKDVTNDYFFRKPFEYFY